MPVDIKPKKGTPIPFRPDEDTAVELRELAQRTGLSQADIIRRALQWALPQYLDGSVSIISAFPHEPR